MCDTLYSGCLIVCDMFQNAKRGGNGSSKNIIGTRGADKVSICLSLDLQSLAYVYCLSFNKT